MGFFEHVSRSIGLQCEQPRIVAVEEPQVQQYMAVVRGVARALARRLRVDTVDIEEFEADGFEALVKVLHDYDSVKGPLLPYIVLRCRGAMIDGLRKRMLISRADHVAGVREPVVISLEQELEDGVRVLDLIADPNAQTAEAAVARAESTAAPSEVAALPRRYQRILLARFLQQRRQKDVAAAEGVSPARVSQIESRIRDRLCAASESDEAVPRELKELTPRELMVLRMAADGASAVETAKRLRKGLETVKTQRKAIIAKLSAKNMMNAVSISYQRGFLH
jgi:RNA polymerase sigma factor (sigma-70 family)